MSRPTCSPFSTITYWDDVDIELYINPSNELLLVGSVHRRGGGGNNNKVYFVIQFLLKLDVGCRCFTPTTFYSFTVHKSHYNII